MTDQIERSIPKSRRRRLAAYRKGYEAGLVAGSISEGSAPQPAPSVAVKVLEPFAKEAERWEPRGGVHWPDSTPFPANSISTLTIGDLRAARSALSAQVQDAQLKVGRFGHHPEPAIDFCIEVEALEGHLFDAKHGIGKPGHEPRRVDDDFRRRVSDAMYFIVGGDQIAITAKATLRSIYTQVQDEAGSPAIKAIAAERARQIEKEGWSPEHDDNHSRGELARAAACYALQAAQRSDETPYEDRPGRRRWRRTHLVIVRFWPWGWGWWKPVDRQRDLEKAGALIAAELDRVIRAAALAKQEGGRDGQ